MAFPQKTAAEDLSDTELQILISIFGLLEGLCIPICSLSSIAIPQSKRMTGGSRISNTETLDVGVATCAGLSLCSILRPRRRNYATMKKTKALQGKRKMRLAPADNLATTDDRFAAAQYDPRFQRLPKAKTKVEIDDRFAGKLTACHSSQKHFLSRNLSRFDGVDFLTGRYVQRQSFPGRCSCRQAWAQSSKKQAKRGHAPVLSPAKRGGTHACYATLCCAAALDVILSTS